MNYVIVGGGISGTTAAEELRRIDENARITICSFESEPLYSRVLLPHYVKGRIPRERVFLKSEDWYRERNIERIVGVRVERLDVAERKVATSDGRKLPFDKLLLATAGELRRFPSDLQGISYLRTIQDADHLLSLFAELETIPPERRRAGIIGGSFIAIEYLNFFAERQIPADLFMAEQTFFNNTLDVESFQILENKLAEANIRIHQQSVVTELVGERRLSGVISGTEQFNLDLLGIGIGIQPDLSWLKKAGIEVNRGIIVNEYLETNARGVYACGDVAEFYDVIAERRIIIGNWLNAQFQGRKAANTMAGDRTRFELVSSYATNLQGIEIIFIGDTNLPDVEQIQRFGSCSQGGVKQLFIHNNHIIGATLINRSSERAAITKAITEKTDYRDYPET